MGARVVGGVEAWRVAWGLGARGRGRESNECGGVAGRGAPEWAQGSFKRRKCTPQYRWGEPGAPPARAKGTAPCSLNA